MQHLSFTLFTALDEDLHRFSLWGQFREIREILKTLEMVVHLLLAFVTALEQNVHFFSLWEPFSSMLLYYRASSTIGISGGFTGGYPFFGKRCTYHGCGRLA